MFHKIKRNSQTLHVGKFLTSGDSLPTHQTTSQVIPLTSSPEKGPEAVGKLCKPWPELHMDIVAGLCIVPIPWAVQCGIPSYKKRAGKLTCLWPDHEVPLEHQDAQTRPPQNCKITKTPLIPGQYQ